MQGVIRKYCLHTSTPSLPSWPPWARQNKYTPLAEPVQQQRENDPAAFAFHQPCGTLPRSQLRSHQKWSGNTGMILSSRHGKCHSTHLVLQLKNCSPTWSFVDNQSIREDLDRLARGSLRRCGTTTPASALVPTPGHEYLRLSNRLRPKPTVHGISWHRDVIHVLELLHET